MAMTTQERVRRMFEHKEADRIPITDSPWHGTILRWQREGMPVGMPWEKFFDVDLFGQLAVDVSPRYPEQTIEETDEYRIYTTAYGVTIRQHKEIIDSTPEFLSYKITDADTWREAKARMTPSDDRINWALLDQNYKQWRQEGRWITGAFWFGFDVLHSWASGIENVLVAMAQDPEWVVDAFNHYLDMNIALYDRMWAKGYEFDSIFWWDDMGYKLTPFFSTRMYRELLKPAHKRAIEWAHAKGIKAELHSCGFIEPLLPDLLDCGLDGLNPIEVKAGMNPLKIKDLYGDRLVLHGGVNAVLWDKPELIKEEIKKVLPGLKKDGGYIFSSDHSIPSSVSLEDFRHIVALVKEQGTY
jgi:uroporphyrinogen decarboxylase